MEQQQNKLIPVDFTEDIPKDGKKETTIITSTIDDETKNQKVNENHEEENEKKTLETSSSSQNNNNNKEEGEEKNQETSPGEEKNEKPKRSKEIDTRKPEDVIGLVKRNRVILKARFGESLTLYEYDSIDCDGAPVVEAFPSIGVVSVLAGMQLVKHMKLPLIGVITSNDLPLSCAMSNEQPSQPARVYGDKRIVIFLCEFQLPEGMVRDVVDCIFDFCRRHKSPMLYTVEGMPTPDKFELPTGEQVSFTLGHGGGGDEDEDEEGGTGHEADDDMQMMIDDSKLAELHKRQEDLKKKQEEEEKKKGKKDDDDGGLEKNKKSIKKNLTYSNGKGKTKNDDDDDDDDDDEEKEDFVDLGQRLYGDKIHYVTTDHGLAARLRGMGYIPVVDGLITGVTGGLLAKAPMTSQEVTAFLAPTSTVFPTASSAVQVLKLLNELLTNISIPTEDLEEMSSALEQMIKGLLAGISTGPKQSTPAHHMMYT